MSLPRATLAAVISLSLANFGVALSAFLIVGILPQMAADLAVSEAAMGQVFTLYAAVYAVASPLLVTVTGRLPCRVLLLASLGLIALAGVVSALADGIGMVLAGRVLAAFGAALCSPVAASVAYAVAPAGERGRALSIAFAGFQIAQAAGVPLAVLVAGLAGWPAAFWLGVVVVLAAMAAIRVTLPARVDTPVPTFAGLRLALRDGRGLAMVSMTMLHITAMCVVYTYLAPLALRHGAHEGLPVGLYGVGGIGASLFLGVVIARLGPARVRFGIAASQLVFLPLFSLPLLTGAPMGAAAIGGLTLLWSAFGVGFLVPQQVLLVERMPDRGTIMLGLNATSNYLGLAFGAAIGGGVISLLGLDWLGIGAVACAAVALTALVISERQWR